jgi:hypothetical protein
MHKLSASHVTSSHSGSLFGPLRSRSAGHLPQTADDVDGRRQQGRGAEWPFQRANRCVRLFASGTQAPQRGGSVEAFLREGPAVVQVFGTQSEPIAPAKNWKGLAPAAKALRTDRPANSRGTTRSSAQTRLSGSHIAEPTPLRQPRADARPDQSANALVLRVAMNATTTNPQSSVIQSPG